MTHSLCETEENGAEYFNVTQDDIQFKNQGLFIYPMFELADLC